MCTLCVLFLPRVRLTSVFAFRSRVYYTARETGGEPAPLGLIFTEGNTRGQRARRNPGEKCFPADARGLIARAWANHARRCERVGEKGLSRAAIVQRDRPPTRRRLREFPRARGSEGLRRADGKKEGHGLRIDLRRGDGACAGVRVSSDRATSAALYTCRTQTEEASGGGER